MPRVHQRVPAAIVSAAAFLSLGLAACQRTPPPPAGMVLIPGGEFTMGTDSERSFPNERPAHQVTVAP